MAAASPCASTSRIGGKDGIRGEQGRLALQTSSRTVRLTAFAALPLPPSELVGIETQDFSPSTRNDSRLSHRLFKADTGVPRKLQDFLGQGTLPLKTDGAAHCAFPSRVPPTAPSSLLPLQGEGRLAS